LGSLFGVPVQREWPDIESLERFLVTEWPETVIELGTGTGSLSLFFAAYCAAHGFRFHTWDTGKMTHEHQAPHQRCLDAVAALGGEVHAGDIFDAETVSAIRWRITKKTFVYCDNGDKPRELRTYAPFMPMGSHIGVHDFGTEVREPDIRLEGFEVWEPEWFEGSTNRILVKT
jgi:cephalosporin hydroxylase